MAFKARTLNDTPNKPNAYASMAPPREVAGLVIPSRLAMFAGEPPDELLKDDLIDVQSLTGKPWPRSSCDRNSKSAHAMRMRAEDGKWPTKAEDAAQVLAEKKLANPVGVATHLLKKQGMSEAKIKERIARAGGATRGIPDVSDIPDKPEPPKRGPGRPRKSED